MTRGRGNAGRTGIAGSASVEMEKLKTGESVPLPADPEGLLITKVVAQTPAGDDKNLEVDNKGTLKVKNLNESGVISGTHSGGGTLPSNSVPDGKAVSVKAEFGNTGQVFINGDYPLLEGDSVELQVRNTDQISYTTENGSESVAFIVEG